MLYRPYLRDLAALTAILFITAILTSTTLATTSPEHPNSPTTSPATAIATPGAITAKRATASAATSATPDATSAGPGMASASIPPITNTDTAVPAISISPILVVCARTDIPNKGAPTLDVEDLERYFAGQLLNRRVNNVQPCATAKIPKPPTPSIYILGLSVDALRRSVRTKYDETGNTYVDDPVFAVALSLSVGHLVSGKVLGTTEERREYHLTSSELDDSVIRKRGCIYETADQLADTFLAEAAAGLFGEEFTSIQQPALGALGTALHEIVEHLATILGLTPRQTTALLGAVTLLLTFILFAMVKAMRATQRSHQQNEQSFNNALALSLKTDNFSEEACRAAAAANQIEILNHHAVIESKEGFRLARAQALRQRYEAVAIQAAQISEFTKEQIIEILRKADAWEFRVLQEAKKTCHF